MTRGLRWGVLAGLVAGMLVIVVEDLARVHGAGGGLLAAAVTGVVIALVRRRIDPPSVRSRRR
jgi:fructose-specific phosphotransferase system IIC component